MMDSAKNPDHTRFQLVENVLHGSPVQLLTAAQRNSFDKFCHALDNLGLSRTGEPEPLIETTALAALLSEVFGSGLAGHLMDYLQQLPGSRLASAGDIGQSAAVPWFGLAQNVVIFDQTPSVKFVADLGVSPAMWELVDAVHGIFPSLEPEMIDPQILPAQIETIFRTASPDGLGPSLEWVMDLLYRNLGWWAVLGFLMMAVASAGSAPPGWAAWPLHVYVLAACMGGWTLTVVGGCILSRVTVSIG